MHEPTDEEIEKYNREHNFPLWFNYTLKSIRKQLDKLEEEVVKRMRR